ncbi:MAG: DUF192 domain-containing protein [Candidatus Shapirobacteria bacterium]|nr:DUF192 domain-containing protein [Candidatus Shapirobacteria bacterium]MDD4383238.1 DUF192 domain-containing protein [Candidatus Shapirobacteria bacterium]
MPKNIMLIITPVLIIIAGILIWRLFFYLPPANSVKIKIGNTNYNIELATTIAQKTKGLSGRNTLCKNCGMLFTFGFETNLPFWMKDTLIPLDMIWLDKNGKIVDIQTATEINSTKIYQNQLPAQFVIELNVNDSQKINLKIGDIIDLSKIND